MPETVAVWLATNTAITSAGYVATVGQLTALTTVAFTAATFTYGNHQRRKQQRAAREAFNDSVQDRLVMTATAQAARSRVYGRVRNVDGVLFSHTHGPNKEFLTMVVAFAGHQVDAIEQVWFNDKPVTLDAFGNVTSEPYNVTARTSAAIPMVVTGGAGTVELPSAPISTPIAVFGTNVPGSGSSIDFAPDLTHPGTLSGSTFSVTGAPRDGAWLVLYETEPTSSRARVRLYTGAPGQSLYSDLVALVGSAVMPSDRFEGVACAIVTLQYDQDVFPSGVPGISAVIRGARVFDPRTSSTQWSENPGLIARDWSLYASGGGCVASEINEPSFLAAANACDVVTGFALPSGGPVVLPLYQCGIVIPLNANPDEALSEICEAMAGQWGWAGGRLSVRAGVYRAPVASITEDWITSAEAIDVTPAAPTGEAINILRPTYADAAQGYVQTPGPEVRADTYVAADGRELVQELQLGGVTRSVHAQHVCGVLLREAREALTLKLPCNLRAYGLELFDVVSVTLPRFGWAAKLFEVVGWRFSLTGGVMLTLRETAAAIYTPEPVFDLINTSPNTGLPRPEAPPAITGLAATSGGVAQIDGSSLARIRVSWNPIASEAVRQSGSIEVQVAEVFGGLPAGDWPTIAPLAGRALAADIFGQRIGRLVAIRARAVNTLGMRGPWRQITHLVSGRRAPIVWRQASAPSGASVQDGDEWVDTDDGNRRYLRSAGAWVDLRDAGIALALSTAEAAQATADGKIDTFWQNDPPALASEGDIWFDTNDGNRQYRRTSGAWVVAADTRIGTAISNAATAQATADGKVRTFVQTSAPGASAIGDLWLDSDDGFRMYRWSGSAWVDVRDAGIVAALTSAAAAQATADGKIDTFWQNDPPALASEGDIWFDTNDGNRQYRRTSGVWVVAADTRIGTAISNAATAQATADGKVRTFVGGSAPTAEAVGDLWLDTANGNRLNRWSGSAWVQVPIGTAGLAPGAATEVFTAEQPSINITRSPPPGAGLFYPNYYELVAISWTNTGAETLQVEVTVDAGALRTAGTADTWVGAQYSLFPLPSTETDSDRIGGFLRINDGLQRRQLTGTLNVAPGQTVYARGVALIAVPSDATSVRGRECYAQITVIKL